MYGTLRIWVTAFSLVSITLACLAGCVVNPVSYNASLPDIRGELLEYASFTDQVAGIAVSREGRIFVSFPRWDGKITYAVAEVLADGSLRPYPDKEWNSWGNAEESRPDTHFIAAQGMFVDGENILWVLDSPSAYCKGRFPNRAKLVGIDLGTDRVWKVIAFDNTTVLPESFLRNVCVDQWQSYAYISDTGTGALIVTDLDNGLSWRKLADDPSTKAEPGMVLSVHGKELRDETGKPVQLHVDGIALDPDSMFLYYHALTARTLYRVRTSYLNDPMITGKNLGEHVERLADTGAADGIAMDSDYNLHLTAPEENAVKRYRVSDGGVATLARDDRLLWPDSVSTAPTDVLYFTTSQFDRLPCLNDGKDLRTPPYKIFRVRKTVMPGS